MASLTLHLVTWNGAKYLPHLFASLREQTMQEWNLVVVDNGSRDNTVVVLEKEFSHFRPSHATGQSTKMRKEIRVVCNVENRGFAGGHNQAFSIADFGLPIDRSTHYIQLLNQDTVLAPDYLEKLVQFLDAHPEVGAVQGALCRWDFAGDVRTDTIDTLGLRVLRTRQVVEVGVNEQISNIQYPISNCMGVFGVSGALPMYRMAALADVALQGLVVGGGRLESTSNPTPSGSPSRRGGEAERVSAHHPLDPLSDPIEIFDSTFFSYKEDVDLAYRLRASGWGAYCVPAARAWHDRTAGVHRTRRQRSVFERRLSWRNHLLMLIANEHPRTFARDWWRIIGYELGKLAYILACEPGTLRAIPQLLHLLPAALRKRKRVMETYRATPDAMHHWYG